MIYFIIYDFSLFKINEKFIIIRFAMYVLRKLQF